MSDIQKMKDELEKLKVLKQAKEELGPEFFEQYCKNIGLDAPEVSKSEEVVKTEVSETTSEPVKEVKKPTWDSVSSVPLTKAEKTQNMNAFLSDLDKNLISVFKDLPGNWHQNSQRNNRLEYQVEIEPGDEIDLLAQAAVANIGKKKIKVDSKDGEYIFTYIFNPIFAHLGFNKRFEVDDKLYKGMGDNGDFKYGMKRVDIKLRQREKVVHRWDLWVNEKDADAGYDEFILMRRDGDYRKIGEQRRITVAGFATVEQVKSVAPEIRNRRERVLKYEVEEKDMCDMRDFIRIVLTEVLSTEEE